MVPKGKQTIDKQGKEDFSMTSVPPLFFLHNAAS